MERSEIECKLPLQLITNKSTEEGIVKEVKAFLDGGGRWVQLRMKDAWQDEIVNVGRKLKALCGEYGAVFIINDNPEIALKIGADGVHIGKNDVSPDVAREILGRDAVVGCTANTMEDIERLAGFDIDYIGLGPYRFTTTKKNLSPVLGSGGYRVISEVMAAKGIGIPVVAIGGIQVSDIDMLRSAGVRFFAVSGAISSQDDPQQATSGFLNAIIR